MKTKGNRNALGRGLDAILQSPDTDITSKDISGNYVVGAIANLHLDQIEVNPFQPRDTFEDDALHELAASIREQGVIQPITVRKLGYEKYQIIAGERRLRAAKIAGIDEIPAYIRVANDEQMLELALIENIHRQELNGIEIGISFQRLMEECKLTQEELSKKVGMSRSTIANYVRLLKLPAEVQIAIRKGNISASQARSFINLDSREDQIRLLGEILENDLSVREVEEKVRAINKRGRRKPDQLPQIFRLISANLSKELQTRVEMKRNNKGRGSIVIRFKTDEEMERIVSLLTR